MKSLNGKLLLFLLCLSALSACLKNEPFKRPYEGFTPVYLRDGWELSSPGAENMDSILLEQAYRLVYSDDRYLMARSLLVIRNGKIVAEAYPNDPDDIEKVYNLQSMTKSVTSVLTGIAVQNGDMANPDELLYDIFPECFDSDPSKRDITIRNALCMQTGLHFDNDQDTEKLYKAGKPADYVLSQPKEYEAGTVMNYNDGAPQLISKAIQVKTGQTLEEYAGEYLFRDLGIIDWLWETAGDGSSFGAFSLFLKPRDIGRIGRLLLQSGKWGNKQLIHPDYLEEAVKTQVTAHDSNEPYGYYFRILPGQEAYYAYGHGGQFLLVAPRQSLVVVYTAWPYAGSRFFDQHEELMNLIMESCQ